MKTDGNHLLPDYENIVDGFEYSKACNQPVKHVTEIFDQ